MSIGKSSLARAAAAANTRPAETAAAVLPGYQQVAVSAIVAAAGDKLPVRADKALVASIEECGVIEPLTVAQTAPGTLMLVAGAKRLAAAKKAGLATVPAVIVELSADKAAALRAEVRHFVGAKAEETPGTVETTAVGQAMPDWLL